MLEKMQRGSAKSDKNTTKNKCRLFELRNALAWKNFRRIEAYDISIWEIRQ
jgi:hypothetical protein